MFINARPRPDLNGFRSFVPSRIVELSYHWPNSMAGHRTSAWGNLRSVASSAVTPGAWSHRSDAASDAESYSDALAQNALAQNALAQNALAQNFYLETSPASPSYVQAQLGRRSTLAAPKRTEHPQPQSTYMMQLGTQPPYDLQELHSPHMESTMPLLGANGSSQGLIMSRSGADSLRFPRAQCSSNTFPYVYQPSLEIDDIASMSSSAGDLSFSSLYNASSASDVHGSNDISLDIVYPSPFEQQSSSLATSSRVPAVQSSFHGGRQWHEIERNSGLGDSCGMSLSFVHDSLTSVSPGQWSAQSELPSPWSQQIAPPGTISPHALSLVAPSSSPILGNNSPRSSSGWLSEISITSQAFQESTGDIPYSAVQSVRLGEVQAQCPDGGLPHARVRSTRVKAVQGSPDEDTADTKSRPAKSEEFRVVKPANARPSIQPPTPQDIKLQPSTSGRQNITMPSVTSETENVDGSASGLLHRAARAPTSQLLQSQKSAGGVQHSARRVLRPRRKLPATRVSETYVPPLSSNAGALSRSHKGLAVARSRTPGTRPDDIHSSPSNARRYSKKPSSMQRPLGAEKSEPETTERHILGITNETKPAATLSGIDDTAQQRMAKDKFLLDSKRVGKSYKQIRLEGGFTEAESTLRGRHRTLTKKPEERVRKPEWESNDLRLLKTAVHKVAGDPSSLRPKKLSWKEVSDYIVDNGGSYRFGNSTCRKKWSELYDKSSDQDLS